MCCDIVLLDQAVSLHGGSGGISKSLEHRSILRYRFFFFFFLMEIGRRNYNIVRDWNQLFTTATIDLYINQEILWNLSVFSQTCGEHTLHRLNSDCVDFYRIRTCQQTIILDILICSHTTSREPSKNNYFNYLTIVLIEIVFSYYQPQH